jgi:radical SAM protein with 4Fe4S-binding SPASM domain
MGFALTLFTNGTLITAPIARRLASLTFLEVGVSVYSGRPEVHDRITGIPGSFHQAVRGISQLRRHRINTVLKCVLFEHTVTGYRSVIALAHRLDARFEFDPVLTPGRDGDRAILTQRVTPDSLRMLFQDRRVRPTFAHRHPPTGEAAVQVICSAGVSSLSVSPSGDVLPCVQLLQKAGNIRRTPLETIWRMSPVFIKLRAASKRRLKTCWPCRLKYYCARCPGLALAEEGDILGPSRIACDHAKITREVFQKRKRKLCNR